MSTRTLRAVGLLGAPLLLAAAALAAAQPQPLPPPPRAVHFKHVIIVVQENRTPDSLFHALCGPPISPIPKCSTTPLAGQYDIQTSGWLDASSPTGKTDPLPVPLANTYDLGHSHGSFVTACDPTATTPPACRMDGSAKVSCRPAKGPQCSGRPQYRYVDNSTGTIAPYLQLATQYGWANHMFQANQGPSYPAHQFLFGGTSAPSADDDHHGIFVSENILGTGATGGFNKKAGCASPAKTRTTVISPTGTSTMYPCFEHRTIPDLLASGLTWRYYVPSPGSIWTAPNSIRHICKPNGHTATSACIGPQYTANVTLPPTNVWGDIDGCKLRSVSWVIPAGPYSDHAGPHAGDGGPKWVASIVNHLGRSTCADGNWKDTAIIITWDDWGGWYDHEAPPFFAGLQGDYQYGFRVPLLVVSAYTPKGYINNARHDFGSILRFVESNFAIKEGALTFDDRRATTDLRAFFSLAVPRPFVPIKAPPLSTRHALDRSEPDDG